MCVFKDNTYLLHTFDVDVHCFADINFVKCVILFEPEKQKIYFLLIKLLKLRKVYRYTNGFQAHKLLK